MCVLAQTNAKSHAVNERCARTEIRETDTRRHLPKLIGRLLCTSAIQSSVSCGTRTKTSDAILAHLCGRSFMFLTSSFFLRLAQGVSSDLVDCPESLIHRHILRQDVRQHMCGWNPFHHHRGICHISFTTIKSNMVCRSFGLDPFFFFCWWS